MEQMDGRSADWFAGLPTWMWLMIAAAFAAAAFVLVVMALAAMSQDADHRVKGWENRPRYDEDPWWKREYPADGDVEEQRG